MDDVEASVRARMSRTRGRDTVPELLVRRRLHALGYRYRVNFRPVATSRRTVDIAFTRVKVAVLIDGCFWHGCPTHYVVPKRRVEFWTAKISGNQARDIDTTNLLETAGWTVLRFWEHEPVDEIVERIVRALTTVR